MRVTLLASALGLALVAADGPYPAGGQPAAKVPRVGLLVNNRGPHVDALEQGLRDLGWQDGKTVSVVRRSAEGRTERLPALAAELVRDGIDVIVAPDPPSTSAAQAATRTIPIVSRSSNDPVMSGLVATLARPGGNITGVYSLYEALGPKRLELLKQAVPGLTRVAVLWDPAFEGNSVRFEATERAARALGLQVHSVAVEHMQRLEEAFRAAKRERASALITLRTPRVIAEKARIVELAARHRLPAMYDEREFVEAGGLMAYGANLDDLYRKLAVYADRILKGARPGELPVEQATTFELVVSRKAALALGLTLPPSFLLRADHLIE